MVLQLSANAEEEEAANDDVFVVGEREVHSVEEDDCVIRLWFETCELSGDNLIISALYKFWFE